MLDIPFNLFIWHHITAEVVPGHLSHGAVSTVLFIIQFTGT